MVRAIAIGCAAVIVASCGDSSRDAAPAETADTTAPTGKPVLYVGLMIHLEGHKEIVQDKAAHDSYRDQIIAYADLFQEYGARATFEVKEPLESCLVHDDHYFPLLEQRGQGIGVHADLGFGYPPGYGPDEFRDDLSTLKSDLEAQGIAARHVSGICSELDWVEAAAQAGFEAVTGVVDFCQRSIDPIPVEVVDCASPADCHDPFGETIDERIHPWRASKADWRLHDDDGAVLILTSATKDLRQLGDDDSKDLSAADVTAYHAALSDAIAAVDPEQINVFFQLWSFGAALPESELRTWLESVRAVVDDDTLPVNVQWATIPEMIDAFESDHEH